MPPRWQRKMKGHACPSVGPHRGAVAGRDPVRNAILGCTLENTRNAAPEVTVARVEQAPLTRTVTVNGTLAAEEEVMLSFKVTGRIDELRVTAVPACKRARSSPDSRRPTSRFESSRPGRRCSRPAPGAASRSRVKARPSISSRPRWYGRPRPLWKKSRVQRDRIQTFVGRGIAAKAELDTANANLQIADGKYTTRSRK